MAETVILVPVPEAEPFIGLFLRKHTEGGAQGIPAHVTLLYPFTDTSQLPVGRASEVAEVIGAFRAFDFSLVSVAYFPNSPRVLYLQPDPDAPFREMTQRAHGSFP